MFCNIKINHIFASTITIKKRKEMNTKEINYKEFYENIVLQSIDLESYDIIASNDFDKVNHIYNIFLSEVNFISVYINITHNIFILPGVILIIMTNFYWFLPEILYEFDH